MQEELCSNRLLIFTDDEAYFRCRHDTYNEEKAVPGRLGSHNHRNSLMPHIFELPADFSRFTELMLYYPRRELTYPSDILRACHGLIRKLSTSIGVHFLEGLPAPLDQSLLFARTQLPNERSARRVGFPSYSWTGWQYIPVWKVDEERGHMVRVSEGLIEQVRVKRTWIQWHCNTSYGDLNVIDMRGNRTKLTTLEYLSGQKILTDRHYMFPPWSNASQPLLKNIPGRSYDLLNFWTISVFLWLSNPFKSDTYGNPPWCETYGKDRFPCGKLEQDTDDIYTDTIGEFALLCEWEDTWEDRIEKGYWAILLERTGPIAER